MYDYYNPFLDNIHSTYTYLLHGMEVDAVLAGGTRGMTMVEKCQSSFSLYSYYSQSSMGHEASFGTLLAPTYRREDDQGF